jgi:cytochrome c-type biogenesis protein CcmH
VLLAVVVIGSLVVGSGVLRSHPPTPAQREAALAAVIRCPTCEDLSVADSDTTSAAAVRHAIDQQVTAGKSDQQIEQFLVGRYGGEILLRPPTKGLSLAVWLVPLLAGVAAVAGLGTVFWRRRHLVATGGPVLSDADRERVSRELAGQAAGPVDGSVDGRVAGQVGEPDAG